MVHKKKIAAMLLALVTGLSFSSCKGEQNKTQETSGYTFESAAYAAKNVIWISPLSSQFVTDDSLKQEKIQFTVSDGLFEMSENGQNTTYMGASYAVIPTKEAFSEIMTQDGDFSVHINVPGAEDMASTLPDITDYDSPKAYFVLDREGKNTGFVVYYLGDELWVAYFQKWGETFSPKDYIYRLDI